MAWLSGILKAGGQAAIKALTSNSATAAANAITIGGSTAVVFTAAKYVMSEKDEEKKEEKIEQLEKKVEKLEKELDETTDYVIKLENTQLKMKEAENQPGGCNVQ